MNSKLLIAGLGLSLVGTLAACMGGGPGGVNGEVAPQMAAELTVSAATGVQSRLVGRYYAINAFEQNNNNVKRLKLEPTYDGMKYKPNESAFKGFEGFDVLEITRKANNDRSDYLAVTLTRDAKVTILTPKRFSWMDGAWTEGATVDGRNKSFTKAFVKGEVKLGSAGKDADPYTVLFAEADGKASQYPGLPTNAPVGTTMAPKPNESCPGWLNKLYTIEGPDKRMYDSWHPQIDPVYWCYFNHEHGSDPALVGLPGFWLGYVAQVNNSQAEIHEGFKGMAIRDETKKIGWYFNVHSETHDLHRVCTRKHTVVVIVTDLTAEYPNNIIAMLSYKGDFGTSQTNREVATKHPVITPPANVPPLGACADQTVIAKEVADDKGEPTLFKRIRVRTIPGTQDDNGGYENWQGGLTSELGLSVANWFGGSTRPKFSIDIRNPSTTCSDLQCSITIPNQNNHGDERTFFVPNLRLEYSRLVEIKDTANGGSRDGYFYTDINGKDSPPSALTETELNQKYLKQFLKPDTKIDGPDGGFHTEDAWRGLYVDDGLSGVPRLELEGSFELN